MADAEAGMAAVPAENISVTNRHLFASELRVAAIGSAYPIPYEAEICPYSSIPQPSFNQLDRDGDGMTDDWENRYGLDRHDPLDAQLDPDKDGFSNSEEFARKSSPVDEASHPPYAVKLRFGGLINVFFPLVFQGASTLPDGRTVFQLNTPEDGKTYFASCGEKVQDVVIKEFVEGGGRSFDVLLVVRNGVEIRLPRGEKIADPESRAELINMLDHSRLVATMGSLLSVRNDEYTVVSVERSKVVVKRKSTGELFDIVGIVEEERDKLLQESE